MRGRNHRRLVQVRETLNTQSPWCAAPRRPPRVAERLPRRAEGRLAQRTLAGRTSRTGTRGASQEQEPQRGSSGDPGARREESPNGIGAARRTKRQHRWRIRSPVLSESTSRPLTKDSPDAQVPQERPSQETPGGVEKENGRRCCGSTRWKDSHLRNSQRRSRRDSSKDRQTRSQGLNTGAACQRTDRQCGPILRNLSGLRHDLQRSRPAMLAPGQRQRGA